MFYKHARVEYVPVGVVGAIVPWNYPFHNIFNPLTAALFAGNAIVIKVRWLTLWSFLWYSFALESCASSCNNIFNPLTAALFAGNAIVIKVRGGCVMSCVLCAVSIG